MLYVMLHTFLRNAKRACTRIQFVSLDHSTQYFSKVRETVSTLTLTAIKAIELHNNDFCRISRTPL